VNATRAAPGDENGEESRDTTRQACGPIRLALVLGPNVEPRVRLP
jgi:hypothetical protein